MSFGLVCVLVVFDRGRDPAIHPAIYPVGQIGNKQTTHPNGAGICWFKTKLDARTTSITIIAALAAATTRCFEPR